MLRGMRAWVVFRWGSAKAAADADGPTERVLLTGCANATRKVCFAGRTLQSSAERVKVEGTPQ
jgi:hypothetical protein